MTRLQTGRSGAHEWRTADPLGCARDDKKERIVAKKGRLLEERAVAEPSNCLIHTSCNMTESRRDG
jgi:hypothetical protein